MAGDARTRALTGRFAAGRRIHRPIVAMFAVDREEDQDLGEDQPPTGGRSGDSQTRLPALRGQYG